ncbi:ABC transporter ATP-binding protein [Tenuibacillus multivorans]|uniref:Putative ABC transport system ATP-binding protein n=1 Tax=Tenuibacillus multivorans TaxID=237069 RepID=A0A1H0BWR9_9BACI|nr:ABC transporter ATP-binding protein [Tenuibacillus multivorans]GEL77006.1 ABC transporter ATP-binding protein [Tenuibacillus multivorans]SDN50007.1 putative ABC transport system ATP-binding protein [Tenuibacillus multivorans]
MLNIKDVSLTFNEDTPDEKKALQGIDLELNKGEFVTVIGSNGAGKSTLMNVVSGSLHPDVGDVFINDQNVVHLPEYKRSKMIGRVFQDPMAGTAPTMTIEENLAMAYARNKKRRLVPGVTKKRKDYFREYLESLNLGLEDRLNAKVGLLSGGERQALSLLMATFTEPHILLLDEHTAALDPSRAELITEITADVVGKFELTTMMVTHNMQQALDLGDRLFMMDKGEIIFDVKGEEKQNLTIKNLLDEFQRIRGKQIESDRAVLG